MILSGQFVRAGPALRLFTRRAAGFYLASIVTRSEYVGCVVTVLTRPSSESEELGMTANGSSANGAS